jgi:type I restriction enzyme M protein
MTIIRRFECALSKTKDAVIKQVEEDEKSGFETPDLVYQDIAGYQFYNKSKFTLTELLNDSDKIKVNFNSYIEGFLPMHRI